MMKKIYLLLMGISTGENSPKSLPMKILPTLFTFLLASTSGFAQSFEWVKFSRTVDHAAPDTRVASDNDGNVYTFGTFNPLLALDGDTQASSTYGINDFFITKFSSDGTLVWNKIFGTCYIDVPKDIAVDDAGHIYVSIGQYCDSISFDDTTVMVPLNSYQIIQFDNAGNFLRNHFYSGSFSVHLATLGNDLYTTHDYFITKHDSLFNTIWSKSITPTNVLTLSGYNDDGDLYVSKDGYLVVCGYETEAGTITIDTVSITFNGGFDDIGIVSMDTSGAAFWGKGIHGALTFACAADNSGNVYWTFRRNTSLIFGSDTLVDQGPLDYYALVKYNASGNEQWAVSMDDDNSPPQIEDMTVNDQQEVVIAGKYSAFSVPGTFGDELLPIGNSLVVAKVDPSGNVIWAKTDNAISNASSEGHAIALMPGDKYAVTGQYNDPEQYGCFMAPPQYGIFTAVISETPEVYPAASFTFSVNGLDYSFTDQSQNADAWLWDFGDGQTSTLQNPVHTFAAGGDYTIVLTAYKLACFDTASSTILNVGIQDPNLLSNTLTLFPNPAHDQTMIGFTLGASDKVTLELCDPFGQIFEKSDLGLMTEGVHSMIVNTETLSPGIYLLRMKTETHHSFARMIKL